MRDGESRGERKRIRETLREKVIERKREEREGGEETTKIEREWKRK